MSYSFPTASSLGILANGTDQTGALNAALSNPNYAGICFDYTPSAQITINGAVAASGKVLQFLRGSSLTGTGSIIGGYIDAVYDEKIWETSLLIKPQGIVNQYYSLKWSGATGNGSTDDWAAIQNDINICTYNGITELYLPAGTYKISKGLLFRRDAGGQYQGLIPPSIATSNFLNGIRLTGDGIAYDGSSGQTTIHCTDANSFAIGLQRVKGFVGKGLNITGVNTGLASYTAYQVLEDPASTFLTNGSRDNIISPHSGVNVDPFGYSSTSPSDMYPNFTGYYTETSQGGSSDVTFEDCVFRYFTVGRAVSINGFSQNGEIINFKNCWADFNKVSLATGQSQSRSVFCHDDHVWGGTMTIYDTLNYGNPGGQLPDGGPPTSIGLNAAGGIRYLCALNNWTSNGLIVRNAHIEMLWSLGGYLFRVGSAGRLTIEDSWVDLAGSFSGLGVTQPFTVFNGGELVVKNSWLFQYDADVQLPLSINSSTATFENVNFAFIPINNMSTYAMSFKDCTYGGGGNFGDSNIAAWNQPGALANKTAPFTTGMKAIFSSFVAGGVVIKERRKVQGNFVGTLAGNYGNIYREIVGIPLHMAITLISVDYTHNTAQFSLPVSSIDYKNLLTGDNFIFYTTDEFGYTSSLTAFGQVTTMPGGGIVNIKGICKGLNTSTSYQLYIYRTEYLINQLVLGDITSGSDVVTNVAMEFGTPIAPAAGTPIYLPHFPLGTTILSYNSSTAQLTLTNDATITEKNVAIISSDWIGEEIGTLPNPGNTYGIGYKKGDRIYNNRRDLHPNIFYWECTKSGITNSSRLPEFVSYDAKESTTYNAASVIAATADTNKVVFLNATANSINYTLDPVAFHNLNQSIFGILSGTNTITITPASGTINGLASYSLENNNCIQVYSDGTNLYIIAKN